MRDFIKVNPNGVLRIQRPKWKVTIGGEGVLRRLLHRAELVPPDHAAADSWL